MDASRMTILARLKQVLLVEVGIVVTLFVAAFSGETNGFFFEMPAGWFTLLLLTSLFSFSMGLTLLWGRANPGVPVERRRELALGFLGLTFINSLSFAIHVIRSSQASFALFCPGGLGLLLLVLYLVLYRPLTMGEDSFP